MRRQGLTGGAVNLRPNCMNQLNDRLRQSPALARVLPFLIFVVGTALQDSFGPAGRYWIYLGKSLAGVWLVWGLLRPWVAEARWAFSWEAVVVGVGVLVIWVGLDPYYPAVDQLFAGLTQHCWNPLVRAVGLGGWAQTATGAAPVPWNPHAQFGEGSFLAWMFVVGRILGSSIVVPPLEEVFYRSFLYRYFVRADFEKDPLGTWHWRAFWITALIFGFSHHEWLAGILCAAAYQWLVWRKKRLGDAMTAHAITNCLLGMWIVWRGAWHFW